MNNLKLLLASWGLSTEPIIQTFEEMVGKPRNEINLAIINEAIKGEVGDHRWFAEELQHLAKTIGGNLEFIDLQSHDLDYIKKRIDANDAIYCFGGNTDYLANTFVKTGFDQLLPQILQQKVWVGSSAGSCVLCHKEPAWAQQTIYQEQPEAERFMEIVPIVFLPHLHGFFEFDRAEIVETSKLTNLPVYAMSDKSALKIEDVNNPVFIGEDYLLAQNRKITE